MNKQTRKKTNTHTKKKTPDSATIEFQSITITPPAFSPGVGI
jgi:hypothetical protein